MADEFTADPVQAAIARELRLLEPSVRASAVALAELLDPEFTEIGASGRRWTRDSIIAALTNGEPPDAAIVASEMEGRLLASGLVHLTYTTEVAGRRAHRSSLWRCRDGEWRVYFHQGTLAPGE